MHDVFTRILFPGRHHILTQFQATYLRGLLTGGISTAVDGRTFTVAPDAAVVFAVTSATHQGTRRNPIPAARREAAIERFATIENLHCVVAPIPDVAPTDDFVAVTVRHVAAGTNGLWDCTPADTLVACSTPELVAAYQAAGFCVAGVELDHSPAPLRPGVLLDMCGRGDGSWRTSAHPATLDVFERYGLADATVALYQDPVTSDDGSLTLTRDYKTYTDSFDSASDRKWAIVAPHVRPGRIVDVGCAAGGLLERAARDPQLTSSELFGVDVSRHLLAEAQHRVAQGVFENPNTFFLRHNMLTGPVMPAGSVDTTTTVALCHEIFSYADGDVDARIGALRRLIGEVFAHTAAGGVWVCSDVCGPDDPDRIVDLTVCDTDGNPAPVAAASGDALEAQLHAASSAAKFARFAADFPELARFPYRVAELAPLRRGTRRWRLRLADAMEFMTRKDYVDNWLSECHESFCFWSWSHWQSELTAAGWQLERASGPTRNEWLVENRFAPVAELSDPPTGVVLDWPVTHMLAVACRPS